MRFSLFFGIRLFLGFGGIGLLFRLVFGLLVRLFLLFHGLETLGCPTALGGEQGAPAIFTATPAGVFSFQFQGYNAPQ